ncbi:glutathione synthase [Aeromicrobium panaciterrae]|uniref:Glutathione synthetase n=1 Tax=Aeromicrobium panaciterrae TaxID=363861 RepID=A0ABU1UPZ6_9ACTN|nr:hypothetical protein [Aeromicrobium panaciterrae]MDR7087251.1 glutathione synthase [Aeromicrobium panaciterrae]
MSALFVTDPLAGLDPEIDSSIGLMAACQELGESVWVCQPEDLAVIDGRLVSRATRITMRPRSRHGDHRWAVEPEWFDVEERRIIDVAEEVSVALMRLDPPVRSRYQNTLHLLDVASAAGVLVANRPDGILQIQEKMFALRFPELIPPTTVASCQRVIDGFVAEHGAAVVKPVDGFAGIDVWLLRHDDPNVASLIESATQGGQRHVIVQRYLPSVEEGNKRLFVLDGEIIGSVMRSPSRTDFRIGPPSAPADVDARDEEIVATLAPSLRQAGIILAGLDVIDGQLIEINVTCPGGMHKTDALLGTDLSGAIMRRLFINERVLPCLT